MTTFTREQLEERLRTGRWSKRAVSNPGPTVNDLVAAMIALLDRAETAEKRMKAWGCPDEDFICYVCGRETPCMTEADLGPGDPGVPCTFDLTYPQMIEQLHHHEDRQRKAEADRDRLRAQLDSILANSDSLESGKLADANAEIARLREKLRAWQEKSDRHESERDSFRLEADRLRAELREAEEAIRVIFKLVLRVKTGEPREAIWSLLKSFKSVASNTPAVRRAQERAK